MVRPTRFGFNAETAETNFFQVAPEHVGGGGGARGGETGAGDAQTSDVDEAAVQCAAAEEFDALARGLERHGVEVFVVDGDPRAPDALFPNNWVSFHRDGTVVLYPMLTPNRRLEVRPDIVEALRASGRAKVERVLDLRRHETAGRALEGTGSVVFDRVQRVAYAGLSPRTSRDVLDELCATLDYAPVTFTAADRDGRPVYHTNVMMGLGTDFAVVCAESVRDERERRALMTSLRDSGRAVIELSLGQMHEFAGNLIELRGTDGAPLLVMSSAAWTSLDAAQRAQLERAGRVLHVPLPTIERYGGGSARCMIAEVGW